MSVLNGFTKYKNYKADSNGDHKLQSFWTSTDTVHGTDANQTPLTTTLENMNTPTFSEASTRANLAGSNESMTTILGKIKKYFTDLGTSAFKNTTDTYSSSGTDPITGTGVADALSGLDASEVGGSGKYIKTISETDGVISATAGDVDTTVTNGSSNLVTSGAVYTAIDNLPEPMIFKGTLGTDGTITTLPTASSSNEGFTYKVITAGTYDSKAAKVGDVFVSNATEWVLIPAGDSDSDTWRNIKVNGTEELGNGISSGAVDFINGTNTSVSFDSDGNKISIDVPTVSPSTAGVAPQGNTVATQTQTTKFLREDGTYQAPSYTEIPSNNVTGSGTSGNIAKFNGANSVTDGPAFGADTTKYLRNDGTWAVPPGGSGGASTLDDLTDVTITSPSDKQMLQYNDTNDEWENIGLGTSTFIPVSEAQFAQLTPTQLADPDVIYFRYEADGLGYAVQDDGSATDLTNGAIPTGRTLKNYIGEQVLQPISEEDYEDLSTAEKNDPKVIYFRHSAPALGYPVQSDASATDLTNGALATGQTIKSYLNSKIAKKTVTVATC